jgi:hypothetical protein
VLAALQRLLEGAGAAAAPALEVEAVVAAAREAPDGAVRNAALALLTVLARAQPQRTLQHILEVGLTPQQPCVSAVLGLHWRPDL